MFGSRLLTFFTAALAGSTIVSAIAPGAVVARSPNSGAVAAYAVKRQETVESQVQTILQTLRSDIAPTLASIKTASANDDVTIEELTPLFADLTGSLDTAAASLATINPVTLARSLASRQTNDELANLIAGIVNDIADALQGLVARLATIPLLAGLLAGVDTSLNQVLLGLGILLQGVLRLVANLLSNVAQLLRNLAFGLSLGTLGL
ncbi:hypothetical protein CPB86DRAFT_707364 [Serendipita vermifera]|nr:hypothetical protein CPB86DRAFT_707364 [Serendipita vermifera]